MESGRYGLQFQRFGANFGDRWPRWTGARLIEVHLHSKSFGRTLKWPLKGGSCLIQVTATAGLTVKQSVVVKQYFEGGLKMVNLFAFEQALKITWIRRMLQDDSKWQLFIKNKISMNILFSCGSDYIKNIIINLKNEFWKDVLKALLKLQTVLEVDNGKGKADHIPIFYNKFLHIANDGFFYKSWFNNGVKYITDLMDSNGNFIKYEEFVEETGVQSNFIQFTGVIACITKFIKENRVKIEKKQGPIFPSLIEVIQKQKKGSQNIYLILNKKDDIPTGKIKWNQIYEIPDHSWGYIYKSPYQLTKCTKLRWFQTSINHRILPTNHLLNKMNISDDPKCTFCGEENETISHLLWKLFTHKSIHYRVNKAIPI